MKINITGLGIISILGSLALTIATLSQTKKVQDVTKKIDMSIDSVSKRTKVELEDAVVKKALDRAVERNIRDAVRDTTNQIRTDVHNDMDKQIRDKVECCFDDIRDKVLERADKEVTDLDFSEMKREVKANLEKKFSQEVWNALGFGKMFGNSNGIDTGALKDLLSTLPEWERSDALENFFKYRRN